MLKTIFTHNDFTVVTQYFNVQASLREITRKLYGNPKDKICLMGRRKSPFFVSAQDSLGLGRSLVRGERNMDGGLREGSPRREERVVTCFSLCALSHYPGTGTQLR